MRRRVYKLKVKQHPHSRSHVLVLGYVNGRCYAASVVTWNGYTIVADELKAMRMARRGELEFYAFNEHSGTFRK